MKKYIYILILCSVLLQRTYSSERYLDMKAKDIVSKCLDGLIPTVKETSFPSKNPQIIDTTKLYIRDIELLESAQKKLQLSSKDLARIEEAKKEDGKQFLHDQKESVIPCKNEGILTITQDIIKKLDITMPIIIQYFDQKKIKTKTFSQPNHTAHAVGNCIGLNTNNFKPDDNTVSLDQKFILAHEISGHVNNNLFSIIEALKMESSHYTKEYVHPISFIISRGRQLMEVQAEFAACKYLNCYQCLKSVAQNTSSINKDGYMNKEVMETIAEKYFKGRYCTECALVMN